MKLSPVGAMLTGMGDNQWTDEKGHTWLRRPDGSTYWWNGTDWQKV